MQETGPYQNYTTQAVFDKLDIIDFLNIRATTLGSARFLRSKNKFTKREVSIRLHSYVLLGIQDA